MGSMDKIWQFLSAALVTLHPFWSRICGKRGDVDTVTLSATISACEKGWVFGWVRAVRKKGRS